MWLVPRIQMNGSKLVMWPETDVGSDLLLTSFSVTHPGLAAVIVDKFSQLTLHSDVIETEGERESCTDPLRALN